MKKHIVMITVATLFFGTALQAMYRKDQENKFANFVTNTLTGPLTGRNPMEFGSPAVIEKLRDGAELYGIQPRMARKIFADVCIECSVRYVWGITPASPKYPEYKAQQEESSKEMIDRGAYIIFPDN